MAAECPFCGYRSSTYTVQLHIEDQHTSSPPLRQASHPTTVSRVVPAKYSERGERFHVPSTERYPVTERRIIRTRYPVDEPSWIKCGVQGCGAYVARNQMNEHLDMHDAAAMRVEQQQRAQRLGLLTSAGHGSGFPSSSAMKRLGYPGMMPDDLDDASLAGSDYRSSASKSPSAVGSAVTGDSSGSDNGGKAKNGRNGNGAASGGRQNNRHSGGNGDGNGSQSGNGGGGSGKGCKGSGGDGRRGWSRSSVPSNKGGGGNNGLKSGGQGGGKSMKSSSSAISASSSRTGQGGQGSHSGGQGGDQGSRGGQGRGGHTSSRSGSVVGGSANDPFGVQGGAGSADNPDMGGLELQLAKLLLANRVNPHVQDGLAGPNVAGGSPNAPANLAATMAAAMAPSMARNSNPPPNISSATAEDLLRALQKGARPEPRDSTPYSFDKRVPSEAANLLAALVMSRVRS